MNAVGDDHDLVVREQAGDVFLVGLELVERAFDGGIFVANVLEFDNAERQAVDENKDVWAAVVAVFNDGELVDGGPVVIAGVLEVNQVDLIVPMRSNCHPFGRAGQL